MSKDISSLDQNLKVETFLPEKDLSFYDVRQAPFQLYGLYEPQKESAFKRLPDAVAKNVSEGVAALALNTAGGRVRFQTNSRYVAIKAALPNVTYMPHMPLSGSSGFDLYVTESGRSAFHGTFMPPNDPNGGYESILYFPDSRNRDLTINFPLYNEVTALYVGLEADAALSSGSGYRHEKPVLYYGSSITQGGCASRPGNSYQAIISRRYDCDYLNFGFSGNARGEAFFMDYLAQLDYSIFVLDYDHNAPSADHLEATHHRAYEIIRGYQPTRPVILISKPDFRFDRPEDRERRSIIYSTYLKAVRSGDQNVYFIDGYSLFGGEGRDGCTVDGCHPNDLGFYRMADVIGSLVGRLLP